MGIPGKLTYKEWTMSNTPFILNNEIDDKYESLVAEKSEELKGKLSQINSREGLENYVRKEKDSLDNILCLLDVAQEKFKRIVSSLRLKKGYDFESEWSLSKTRGVMLEQSWLMDEICTLFLDGVNTVKFLEYIPKFHLRNFRIDVNTMARLASFDTLERLIKKDLEVNYNKEIGSSFSALVQKKLEEVCRPLGLTVIKGNPISLIGRNVDFHVSDNEDKNLIVDVSYMVTTSSTQTTWKEKIKETHQRIRENGDYMQVTFIDGSGWLGRQSDAKEILRCSKYCLNLKNVGTLESIINFFF